MIYHNFAFFWQNFGTVVHMKDTVMYFVGHLDTDYTYKPFFPTAYM